AAGQKLAQRTEAVAAHHDPLAGLAGLGGEVAGRAVDEEADRDREEAERELGRDREILAALGEMRVGESEDRTQRENPQRVQRLELRRIPIEQVRAEQAE